MTEEEIDCNPDGKEVGYNYINTAFTGTINPSLSGNSEWVFPCSDRGTAGTTNQMENL